MHGLVLIVEAYVGSDAVELASFGEGLSPSADHEDAVFEIDCAEVDFLFDHGGAW